MKKLNLKFLIILLLISFIAGCSIKPTKHYVGFKYFMVFDSTRQYLLGQDTTFRPELIYFWYPTKECSENNQMKFNQYVDLISLREDFDKTREVLDEDNCRFINAYAQFAKKNYGIGKNVTTQQILDSPAQVFLNSLIIDKDFPLIIYAPSNSKTPAQNHMICERLASEGYYVISVASAGVNSVKREDATECVLAQVEDMEFILDYFEHNLKIGYSSLGLLNFSAGGLASTIFQMKHSNVNAIFSMDGSNEYSYYMSISKLSDFDIKKANVPYFLVSNKDTISIYPYYNSIKSHEKYFLRMPQLSHFGFVSFWSYFDNCDPDTVQSNYTISYQKICDASVSFFNATLKNDKKSKSKLLSLKDQKNEYAMFEEQDNKLPVEMLNIYLQQDMDAAILKYKKSTSEYNYKADSKLEKSLSILSWTIIDNDIQSSIKLFSFIKDEFPDSWNTYYNLAYALKMNGQFQEAKKNVLKAKELNSSNEDIKELMEEISEKE